MKTRSGSKEHTLRTSDGGLISLRLTRKLAMEAHCTECMCWDDPKECTAKLCALYPFRKKTLATKRAG